MVELSNQFGKPYFTKGGQGKLFHDPKPVDEHRYQRGYTPERMNEIKGSMIDISSSGKGTFAGPAGINRVYQTIARSATPAHEFNDTPAHVAARKTNMDPEAKVDASDLYPLHIETGRSIKSGVAGDYSKGGNWERGQIRIGASAHGEDEQGAGQTLIHELGHYRSEKVENLGHQQHYRKIPSETGREEAFADDNMVERWRPDPRDVRKGKAKPVEPAYENSGSFRGMGGKKAHGPYIRARTTLSDDEKRVLRVHGFRPYSSTENYKENQRIQAAHDAQTNLVNDQLFHRDYGAEDITGKPAWQPNKKYASPISDVFSKQFRRSDTPVHSFVGGEPRVWPSR